MAQLAEQLICNQQVFGSSPNIGSLSNAKKYFDSSVQACLVRLKQKYFFILRSSSTEQPKVANVRALRRAQCELLNTLFGRFPEWPKGADCKSVSDAFGGSNPPPSIYEFGVLAQLGEHLPYKQRVTGSSPVGPTFFYIISRGGAVWKLVGLITRRS